MSRLSTIQPSQVKHYFRCTVTRHQNLRITSIRIIDRDAGLGSAIEVVDVEARVAKFLSGTHQFSRSMRNFHLDDLGFAVARVLAVEHRSSFRRIVEHEPRHALPAKGERLRGDDVHVTLGQCSADFPERSRLVLKLNGEFFNCRHTANLP